MGGVRCVRAGGPACPGLRRRGRQMLLLDQINHLGEGYGRNGNLASWGRRFSDECAATVDRSSTKFRNISARLASISSPDGACPYLANTPRPVLTMPTTPRRPTIRAVSGSVRQRRFNFRVPRNRRSSSILWITINIVVAAVSREEAACIGQFTNELAALQIPTAMSFVCASGCGVVA